MAAKEFPAMIKIEKKMRGNDENIWQFYEQKILYKIYTVKTSSSSDLLLTLLGPFFISVHVPFTFQVPAFV